MFKKSVSKETDHILTNFKVMLDDKDGLIEVKDANFNGSVEIDLKNRDILIICKWGSVHFKYNDQGKSIMNDMSIQILEKIKKCYLSIKETILLRKPLVPDGLVMSMNIK